MVERLIWYKQFILPKIAMPSHLRLKLYELQLIAQLVWGTYDGKKPGDDFPHVFNLSNQSNARRWALNLPTARRNI